MSLYQVSVLKKHLKLQDQDKLDKAYRKYTKYFLNPTIQENIRSSKEEEYQGIFLTELFVNVLDYTLKPKADFNLVAEYKNQNNARKADGAILDNDLAIGVIELKGTNTKDLESIRKQAFDYKANQKGCIYVITSNFEKLRFYINDATEFEEFNLFELPQERFELLYLCLQKDNVINNIPLQIKEASIVVEEQITKQFYKDYSLFKRELYRDLVKRNAKGLKNGNVSSSPGEKYQEEQTEEQKAELVRLEKNVKLTLFKKSQKLIDRFLFIFFAEDRGLLPPNSTQQILDKWKADIEFGDDRPLYNLFKQYFKFLDQGRAGVGKRAEIYAYNGGLFKKDNLLDNLVIDNELLYKYTKQLAGYDFESQVDVNILGHIFENSLNEIESVNAEIEGGDFDKQKSKRKKDGVFYTPKYITKYIVENTIGKLCEEKKTELGFKEEEYFKGRKNRNKTTIEKLVTILDTYRDWLLHLTICDPACGSGAFLNQALDFLIKEHTYIDELKTKVLGGGLQFPDIENTILENNIYGVDLNEESIEIAKLSLWLRTAQPRRKLNDLSSNIKCGNSLIDSKAVAGDKAFNWQEQFPKVFAKDGFDVVIGNPPYVKARDNEDVKGRKFIESNYISAYKMWDLYIPFIEKSLNILKHHGINAMIIPDTIGKADYASKLVDLIEENYFLYQIDFFPDVYVFENVGVRSKIPFIRKTKSNVLSIRVTHTPTIFDYDLIKTVKEKGNSQYLLENAEFEIPEVNTSKLEDICYVSYGMRLNSDKQDPNKFKKTDLLSENINDINSKAYTEGKYIDRYIINKELYLEWNTERSPNRLVRPTFPELYPPEKLLLSRQKRIAAFSGKGHYCDNTIIMAIKAIDLKDVNNNSINKYYKNINKDRKEIEEKSKLFDLRYLLSIINSKMIAYFIKYESKGKIDFYPDDWKKIPIKNISKELQSTFVVKVDFILQQSAVLNDISAQFQRTLNRKFELELLPKKLQYWYELDFTNFIKELKKKKILLSLIEETDWEDYFLSEKLKANELQTQINQTDAEIDAMVYELYDLTNEEITIVENG
ncbi:Eco57I restriction-modification methylase domain-containing protein [Psychroserpens burtonensis]|uniref:Eco57I restriction-modification methylase domain-containing protein n=1 Tax=Psychroserpens burtonensis TaxID=49278 RepID=UPI00040992C6|nr:N-6 DNA methylase [Psychroserpens burtonensis]